MEFVQALNPLYAFPIVAVILCAFIVYAFGFKSPVQPPSFDGIEEEKKISKKRKTKDTSKGKVIQNGKVNGSTSSKAQVLLPTKKKEVEKSVSADKPVVEKAINERKVTKKSKQPNEKKSTQEKKRESFPQEDAGEDGWVQLISKKGRKIRKKDEIGSSDQTLIVKPVKNAQINKSDVITPPEESPKADVTEDSATKKKPAVKDAVPSVVSSKESVVVDGDPKADTISLEKSYTEENAINLGKLNEETSNKSKKKKKKTSDITNLENDHISPSESSAGHVISELSSPQHSINDTSIIDDSLEVTDKVEESQPKETKPSNVVFDELAGLYPEPREQRKKKRVRRDH